MSKRRGLPGGHSTKARCSDPLCPGWVVAYTHSTFPLGTCSSCGFDHIIDVARHRGGINMARPVPARVTA